MITVSCFVASSSDSSPLSRIEEAFKPGEAMPAHARVFRASDGRLYLAGRGQSAIGLTINATPSWWTSENSQTRRDQAIVLVDLQPVLSRSLPPVEMIAARPFGAGCVLFAADGGRVSDEAAGDPVGRSLEASAAPGQVIRVGPIDAPLPPPKPSTAPAAVAAPKATPHRRGASAAASNVTTQSAATAEGAMMTTTQTQAAAAAAKQDIVGLFEAAIRDEQNRCGLTRVQAATRLARRNPAMHREYLAACSRSNARMLANAGPSAGDAAAAKAFEAKVAELQGQGLNYSAAVVRAVRQLPGAHRAYLRMNNPAAAGLVD